MVDMVTLEKLHRELIVLRSRLNSRVGIGQSIVNGSAGCVLFTSPIDLSIEKNLSFIWDNSNSRLGVNVTTPGLTLHVASADARAALIGSSTSGSGALGIASSTSAMRLEARNGANTAFRDMEFYTASTAAMNIDSTNSNVAIGQGTTNAASAALLELESTTMGFLPPRMTETQRDNISSPLAGLIVYNSTTNVLNFHNGTTWGAI